MSKSQVSSTKHIVDIQPVTQEQLKYGALPIQDFSQVQLKYGAYPITEVQPAYGVPFTGYDLSITYEQLEENISTLKKAISSLKNSWENQTKTNLTKIENSWVGPDCKEYVTKLKNMDTKVNNTISALELLCSTYEQARDMVSQSQTNSLTSIQKLN